MIPDFMLSLSWPSVLAWAGLGYVTLTAYSTIGATWVRYLLVGHRGRCRKTDYCDYGVKGEEWRHLSGSCQEALAAAGVLWPITAIVLIAKQLVWKPNALIVSSIATPPPPGRKADFEVVAIDGGNGQKLIEAPLSTSPKAMASMSVEEIEANAQIEAHRLAEEEYVQ